MKATDYWKQQADELLGKKKDPAKGNETATPTTNQNQTAQTDSTPQNETPLSFENEEEDDDFMGNSDVLDDSVLDIPEYVVGRENGNKNQIRYPTIHFISVGNVNIPNKGYIKSLANTFFQHLKLNIVVEDAELYGKKWQNFDFDQIQDNDAVCIIGNHNGLCNFVLKKLYIKYNIANLGSIPTNLNWEQAKLNISEESRQNPLTNFLWGVNDLVDSEDNDYYPEISTNGIFDIGKKKINIIAINYAVCMRVIKKHKIPNRIEDFIAYIILHGIGHTSSFSYGGTHNDSEPNIMVTIPFGNIRLLILGSDDWLDKLYKTELGLNEVYKEAVKNRYGI